MTMLGHPVTASLVAGERLDGDQHVPVHNPHDGRVIAMLGCASPRDVEAAVAAARRAQGGWAATPAVRRGEILHQAANAIESQAEELAEIVAAEAGKRRADALAETRAAVQCARFFAGEGQRLFGRTIPSGQPDKYISTVREPCGVAALITAANTPAPNFSWKVFPALICGNAVVLKPSEDTPLSADWLARRCHEAGVPPGALNVIHGLGEVVGQALVESDDVDVISFTGSTRVGRAIGADAGGRLKKVSLELGGKNALVVCDDADLDKAARWAALSAFSNAGQRCAAGSRIIVFDSVFEAFAERLLKIAGALKLGVADDCDLGPVINARQLSAMLAALSQAKAAGARILTGGKRAAAPELADGFYLEPTLLAEADSSAEISRKELFGPIANLYRVAGFDEALALANDSPYGLTAAIHTTNFDRAVAFAHGMRAGVVMVNAGTYGSEPHLPFGGLRQSGNGTREPGTEALDIYCNLKSISLVADPSRL